MMVAILRSGRRIFFSSFSLFGICSTPVSPQWHVEDTCHFAESTGGRWYAKLDRRKREQADYALHAGIVWEPIRETNSHATRQGTPGHSCLGSLSHCGLILAQKKVDLLCAS